MLCDILGGQLTSFFMAKMYLFHSTLCTPCGVVKRHFANVKYEGIDSVLMMDLTDETIDNEANRLADKYGVPSFPLLVIVDDDGNELERYEGPTKINGHIKRLLKKYYTP